MKYYSYYLQADDGSDNVDTLSEDEILKEYYEYWYSRMCKKFGKEHVDSNYSKLDCIDDWVVVNWAWLVNA